METLKTLPQDAATTQTPDATRTDPIASAPKDLSLIHI